MNFGGFATPERRLIFDINDLDETLPAPWEWDVKRPVASFVLAARAYGLTDAQGRDAAVACARSYRRKMRDFTSMDVLDVWYARLGESDFLAMLQKYFKAGLSKQIAKATAASSSELVFPKLVEGSGGRLVYTTLRRPFLMPRGCVPRAIWTSLGKLSRNTAKPWPKIAAFCSILTEWSTRRSRSSASAASEPCAWWP